ncbi:MAG: hypothetical protein JW908_03805 [Anaerolineales bacterium]|nr:hypothetical protein [Anaerolineales bacterium]
MNYAKILKRGWEILWSYKTLWVFGIILALTTNSGFNGNGSRTTRREVDSENFNFTLPSNIQQTIDKILETFNRTLFSQNYSTLIGIGIAVLIFIILISIIFAIGRYVSQTALIKMVDTYETSGEKVNWQRGFRLGWSRQAWQLFLINLVIFLPLTLLTMGFLGCAIMPVIVSMAANNEPTGPGMIASIGLFFLIIFVAAIIGIILSLFMEIIYRECVLEGQGVMASIRNGWKKVTRNFKDVFLMWLILIGVRFGYFLVTIPIVILLIGIALLAGGGIGVALYFVGNAISATSGWIIAAIVGGTIFMIIFSFPKLFLDGVFETYTSSVWTLTYRELNGLDLGKETLPAPDFDEPKMAEKDDSQILDQEIPPAI